MDEFDFLSPDSFRMVRAMEGTMTDIWDYLTLPELLEVWLAPGVFELRPGGRVELQFNIEESVERQKAGAVVYGRIREIEPERTIEYDWTDVPPGGSRLNADYPDSVVRFELLPIGDMVQVTVIHRGLPTVLLAGCAAGWHVHLSILASVVAGEMPEPFEDQFVAVVPEYQAKLAASGIDLS